eukprot:gnl/TRDRNA2_/TRDRNA2_127913_c0_seq2.p1 gnl/TRDRNA2_/TRDRNA2_127913_c0~~gnl/TRDRNA2_/TRDRNA2_127913_c0_seq2.p1  ORF type:complete len:381 (+),score=54.27 gnl/TRDRNA2_/TRDRNA2_127913_c0_seq2:63-1205(+)
METAAAGLDNINASLLKSGSVAYCRLLHGGVVKSTKAIVVSPGLWQSVVACPGELALDCFSDDAASSDKGAWQRFKCACVLSDVSCDVVSCDVVFYSLETAKLSSAILPGALNFQDQDGQSVSPCTESLVDLFNNTANGDALQIETSLNGSLATALYHEVKLGDNQQLFAWNSILVIPEFLSKDECHVLIDACDRGVMSGSTAGGFYSHQGGMNRLPVRKLDLEAQMLSSSIMSDRLLAFFEQHVPDVALEQFGQSSGLKKMKQVFSPGEPAVNRYMVGGGIKPHTDKQAITLNVLLSEPGAFTGGGTLFWPQGTVNEDTTLDSEWQARFDASTVTTLLRPQQGTAVLFNGQVVHAGRAVSSGIRHTYVASFNLIDMGGM